MVTWLPASIISQRECCHPPWHIRLKSLLKPERIIALIQCNIKQAGWWKLPARAYKTPYYQWWRKLWFTFVTFYSTTLFLHCGSKSWTCVLYTSIFHCKYWYPPPEFADGFFCFLFCLGVKWLSELIYHIHVDDVNVTTHLEKWVLNICFIVQWLSAHQTKTHCRFVALISPGWW